MTTISKIVATLATIVFIAVGLSACGGGSGSSLSAKSNCAAFLKADNQAQAILVKRLYKQKYVGDNGGGAANAVFNVSYFCGKDPKQTVAAVLAGQGELVGQTTPVVTTPTPSALPARTDLIGPPASATPEEMVKRLDDIRRQAFCEGYAKGAPLLDQFWAYRGAPKPFAFGPLLSAADPNENAPAAPHSTYAKDLSDLQGETQSTCSHVFPSSDMVVVESYPIGSTQRVVATLFKVGPDHRVRDGYTAIYDLIDGHWFVDQMH